MVPPRTDSRTIARRLAGGVALHVERIASWSRSYFFCSWRYATVTMWPWAKKYIVRRVLGTARVGEKPLDVSGPPTGGISISMCIEQRFREGIDL